MTRAWVARQPGPIETHPPELVTRQAPEPAADEVLVHVTVCGVCRTDLHLLEGDLPPRRPGVVPGHQVVGRVVAVGEEVSPTRVGERVGIPWLRRTCGRCGWCRTGRENLCPHSEYTGWDADGGYAEQATAPADWVYRVPETLSDEQVAPLLCGGIIGYRALRAAAVRPGGRVALHGFGSSAHIAMQIALAQGTEVYVHTRGAAARRLARELGATWVGGSHDRAPRLVDGAVLFAPAGGLVPGALRGLDRGGTLALAGIHVADIPALDYQEDLFQERCLRSVTANTRQDGDELLALAGRLGLFVRVTTYPFDDLPTALQDLESGHLTGSAVVLVDPGGSR